MELDDFKKRNIPGKDPETADSSESYESIDKMIELFRLYEKKQRRKVINIVILNLSLASIYFASIAHRKGLEALGFFILGFSLIGAVIYLLLRYRPLRAENYSLPIKEFAKIAERRVSYLSPVDYIILMPLLGVIGTGAGMVFTTSLQKYTDNSILIIFIWTVFFVSLCVFGFWTGKKTWKKEYGDMHAAIRELKDSSY